MRIACTSLLAVLLLSGCAHISSNADAPAGAVDCRAWVIETDSATVSTEPSAASLFSMVSNGVANVVFERHGGVTPEQATRMAEVTEAIYPTDASLTADNILVPSRFMRTEVGTIITVILRRADGTSGYTMEVDAELCRKVGEEKPAVVSPVSGNYELGIARFLTQTVSAYGPCEPEIIHVLGCSLWPQGKKQYVLVQFKPL